MKRVDTSYATTADGVHIAYQIVGDGPLDLVFVPEWVNHVEAQWEQPAIAHFLSRLAAFSRVLLFDKRGTGLSDPISLREPPTLEQWLDDLLAVLDAAGSTRAALWGHGGGGGMITMLFAAMHPSRTTSLVVSNTQARAARGPDYPWGVPAERVETVLQWFASEGMTGRLGLVAPSRAGDQGFEEWHARYHRLSTSPGTYAAIMRVFFGSDIRHVLPAISVPTLVLHRRDDAYVVPQHGRYVADHVAGAQYEQLSGADHLYFLGDVEELLAPAIGFLTGAPPIAPSDRHLATILFTDIERSTEQAATLGDRHWRTVLDAHDELVGRQLDRFRGRLVKSTGDGFLALFDGPARAISCACAMRDAVHPLGLRIRAGLHAGEVELRGDDVGGIAVHLAARVAAKAAADEVLVSRTVTDLVAGSGIGFVDRGTHTLKGVPGEWQILAVAT